MVKELFNYSRCELTTVYRFDDNELLQDAHACANGEHIDIAKYGTEEHDLCLAWTNEAVNKLNKNGTIITWSSTTNSWQLAVTIKLQFKFIEI